MSSKLDLRQSVLRTATPQIGSAANASGDSLFPLIDAQLAKHFEDRNVLITDGGIITFTGTQIQFTENLNLSINQKISGADPQTFSLGQATLTLANNEMVWAIVNRSAGTATVAQGTTMPAVSSANQEIFLLVKRIDAGDGTQRIYWRTGAAFNAGQSARLGSAGSGSGGGTGDDLDALLYKASFKDGFDEGPTDSKSAVDTTAGKTDPGTYNAAKAMYTLSYDAAKTIAAATTTTNIVLSAAAAYTVKTGDVVVNAGVARIITAVISQTNFTTNAFPVAPTLGSQVTVSQAVHTKDIYNLAVDGNALSAAFAGATFSDTLVDYEDTTTAGDNIFDVNTAPVVGFTASVDATTWTGVTVRPTLESTQIQSLALPAAGTALYFRFFANKTSGSGIVNVLGYRSFMQKDNTTGIAGGITNSAYAFTNGVGTPLNCTVGVAGGKTVVALTFQYPVGVYSGSAESALEVWLNGSVIPRFVNSTLTPDASFTESSSGSITLDRDYSTLNLAVKILQRTQIVDNSTTNTTAISDIQGSAGEGFQAFVKTSALMNATTTVGTPAAGTFYSSISNRASITDLSQDLKPRMGIDRVMTQQLISLQNEVGPSGEPVFSVANDTLNQIRFVGSGWTQSSLLLGGYPVSNGSNDFVEITFFGTGLNILLFGYSDARDLRASVDGGAEGSNIYLGATTSNVLQNRNYATNQVFPVASGLTLGVHTVKLRTNAAINNVVYGFEILNNSANVITNPGVSFNSSKKLSLLTQSSIAHNATVTGTRGGRVLHYQKADGTIGQAFTPVNAASALLSAADHSNEEIARVYNWREFGAGRTDDFSGNFGVGVNLAFTLDDDTTSLVGSNVTNGTFGNTNVLYWAANGAYITFTFVGTGCDYIRLDTGATGPDTFTLSVDGGTPQTMSSAATGKRFTQKLVSGLPYGTHSVRITRTSVPNLYDPSIVSFIVYQPKKPALPTGATEIADYNVMANYVFNSGTSAENVSTGVLNKFSARELIYVGANWSSTLDTSVAGGLRLITTGNGQYVQYTFFGTGFEYNHYATTNSGVKSFTIDGLLATSTNFPSATVQVTSGLTYTSSTGQVSGAPNVTGAKVSITGLTLGFHTVIINKVSGTELEVESISPITPIHATKSVGPYDTQNTIPVGSQGIADTRKLTPVKDLGAQTKSVSQANGLTSSPTTTSTSYVPLADMNVIHSNKTGRIKVSYSISLVNTGSGAYVQAFVDGMAVGTPRLTGVVGSYIGVSDVIYLPVSPGTHQVILVWYASSGTNTSLATYRDLLVEEV